MGSLYSTVPRVLLLTGLLTLVTFSGCLGGGDKKETPPTGGFVAPTTAPPTTSAVVDCAADEDASDCANDSDPTRHYHHYWGEGANERTQVDIFYREGLEIEQKPFYGNNEGCRTIGHRDFNLETDEDDAGGELDPPVNENPVSGRGEAKADVVFAGTVKIEVELLGFEIPTSNVPVRVKFQYKPSNLNVFLPSGSVDDSACGMDLAVGEVREILVGPGGADPPHQWLVSRWAFRVWFVTQADENGEIAPHAAQGTFGLRMTAINGGKASLDPAHPDLWAGSGTYELGCTKVENIPRQVVVTTPEGALDRAPEPPLSDIKWEYGRIVPLQTEKVTGTLKYQYTGPVAGTKVVPMYYGGDSSTYRTPDEWEETTAGEIAFTIYDQHGVKADPPYLAETQWRFQLLPVSPTPPPPDEVVQLSVSEFEGWYEFCFTAHRDPNAPPME